MEKKREQDFANQEALRLSGVFNTPIPAQPPIAEQLKAAQREAQEHRAPDGPKKKAPDRGDR